MAKHLVTCRVCGVKFDAQPEGKDTVWVMPSKNYYYHKHCYGEWKVSDTLSDEEWAKRIYDFLARDLRVTYDFQRCDSQRKNFIKTKKYTNKGMFFALKYYYEIKHQKWEDEKTKGGIGIIPYIYTESVEYWVAQETKNKGTISAIEKQMREREERKTETIIRKKTTQKRKPKFTFEDIEGDN